MEKQKEKKTFEQGVKYRGYAFINEYGEWNFRPQEARGNIDGLKVVADINGLKLYENDKNWKFSMLLAKQTLNGNELADIEKNLEYLFKEYINVIKGDLKNGLFVY